MPAQDHYVIIGNGPAGNAAADTLRENDAQARVTIISDEMFTFYYRHMLPDFIAGEVGDEKLKVRPYTVYKEKNIRLRLGQRVDRIDPETRTLYLRHMEMVHYTKLIVAVGGRPNVPPWLERYREHLTMMSTYQDAVGIRPLVEKADTVLILGGDLVSLSVTKHLQKMKKKIYFLLDGESFWPLRLTPEMKERISANLCKGKIDCMAGVAPASIEKKGAKFAVTMDNGEKLTVDLIGCFMGMMPNIGFILGCGIDTERGILVDDRLRTNYPDVYACGDCAQIYSPELKNYWVSIGWANAEVQGRTAALNVLGDNKVIKPIKKKALDVEGLKINTSWWKEF